MLAALTKEQVWVIASLFGIYLFFVNKKRFLGILLTVFSLSVFYYLITKAIPQAAGAQHFALSYYSDFGESPLVIIKNIFLSPGKVIGTLLHKEQLIYLIRIFSPINEETLLFLIDNNHVEIKSGKTNHLIGSVLLMLILQAGSGLS